MPYLGVRKYLHPLYQLAAMWVSHTIHISISVATTVADALTAAIARLCRGWGRRGRRWGRQIARGHDPAHEKGM